MIDKLLIVLPGTEQNNMLLRRLNSILPAVMQPIGFRVSSAESIWIVGVRPPDELLRALQPIESNW